MSQSSGRNQVADLDALGLLNLPITRWEGREFVTEGRRCIDFASTNYLGFDFDPLLRERGEEYSRRWSSIAGWSRLEVDPEIYGGLETKLNRLLGSRRVHLSHTITITGFSIIPTIAQKGMIFADWKLHTVVWEACRLARDHGAKIERFRHQDLEHLESLLKQHADVHPKLIAVDGVYSISTELAPIRELQALCERYDAWLYVDDAHGFGVLGQEPNRLNPYGRTGSGIVRRAGGDYRRTFYVSSFGKAFCTYTAFATIPDEYEGNLRASSLQYIFSAPPNPYLIGTVDAALELNDFRGEFERARMRERVSYLYEGMKALGLRVTNELLQPVVFLEVGSLDDLVETARAIWARGVVAGLRAYPVVPPDQCGLRFALSSLHTREQLDHTLNVLEDVLVRPKLGLRTAIAQAVAPHAQLAGEETLA